MEEEEEEEEEDEEEEGGGRGGGAHLAVPLVTPLAPWRDRRPAETCRVVQ